MRTENRAGYTHYAASMAHAAGLGDRREVALHLIELASKGAAAATILPGGRDAKSARAQLLSAVYPREATLSKEDQTLLTRATVVVTTAYDVLTKRDAKSADAYSEACRWARDDLAWARAYVSASASPPTALVVVHTDGFERSAPNKTTLPALPALSALTPARQKLMSEVLVDGAYFALSGLSLGELLLLGNPAYTQANAGAPPRPMISRSV